MGWDIEALCFPFPLGGGGGAPLDTGGVGSEPGGCGEDRDRLGTGLGCREWRVCLEKVRGGGWEGVPGRLGLLGLGCRSFWVAAVTWVPADWRSSATFAVSSSSSSDELDSGWESERLK